jgi:hypothetical protein
MFTFLVVLAFMRMFVLMMNRVMDSLCFRLILVGFRIFGLFLVRLHGFRTLGFDMMLVGLALGDGCTLDFIVCFACLTQ